jgi:DNA-binding transcriptional LysR family regulator
MDQLQAMRAFARVVETGGFARAAQSLQMPNATLSKAIQALEKHLGVKLLERSTRRVSVTRDGVAYYERTQPLRIDTGGSTASGLLIPALPEFCARYPDIELQVGVTDRTVDVIGENIDCAIRSTANDGALISRKIGTLPWTTCASVAYLERHGEPTHPQQIIDQHFPVAGYFSAHSGVLAPLHFNHQGQPLAITPPCKVMVNESNAHLATALAGIGLIQTLDFMVRPAINTGELMPILQAWRPAPLDVYFCYAPSRQLSTKVRVFAEWVASVYARLQEGHRPG